MENLLEDNLLRHFSIVSYLAFKEWLPISDMANDTALSIHTIQKDIGEINIYIAPAKIETSLKFGIRLTLPPDLNTFYLFSQILRESVNFLILEEILLHKFEKIIDLADKLYISDSTLKRKIYRINKVLAPLNFQINPMHMDLSGDESQITWFFSCYFIEKYTVLDALVSSSELHLLDNLLNEFYAAFPVLKTPGRQNFSFRNRARINLFVHLKRLERGHTYTSPKTAIDIKNFQLSPNLQTQIHSKYQLTPDATMLYGLFFQFFNPKLAWSTDDFEQRILTDSTAKKIVDAIEAALTEIETTIDITIPNKTFMRMNLYNKFADTSGRPRILFLAAKEFFMNVNDYYCKFTSQVNQIMQKHFNPLSSLAFVNVDQITMLEFKLITSWENLGAALEQRAPVVRAGLFFNTNYEHTQFVMNDVFYHLKSRLAISIVDASTVAELTNDSPHYDMIITNLSALVLPDIPIVSIHANPTAEDFTAILAQYNRVIDHKVDADLQELQKTNSIFA